MRRSVLELYRRVLRAVPAYSTSARGQNAMRAVLAAELSEARVSQMVAHELIKRALVPARLEKALRADLRRIFRAGAASDDAALLERGRQLLAEMAPD